MLLYVGSALAQTGSPPVAGLWRIMDGDRPDPVSLIAISEQGGVVSGTVMRVMHSSQGEHPVCNACKGPLHDKPVVGMTVLWGLTRDGAKAVWTGGQVLDPAKGQIYRAKLTLKDPDTLEVRGFLGISLLGRTQIWRRAQPSELTAALPKGAST